MTTRYKGLLWIHFNQLYNQLIPNVLGTRCLILCNTLFNHM